MQFDRFCSVPVGQLEYSESMDGLHTDDHEPLNSLTTVSGHAHIADRAIANFVNAIGRHFNDRELSDVTLKVASEEYASHRFVLAKSSDVFKSMLYNTCWKDTHESSVRLHESKECEHVFGQFLRYFYTAGISIDTDNAVPLLCLADKYEVCVQCTPYMIGLFLNTSVWECRLQKCYSYYSRFWVTAVEVTSLIQEITLYMSNHCKSPNVENAMAWYPWAKALHLLELMTECKLTLCWNFERIIDSDDWLTMDIEFIEDIVSSSELIINNELMVWDALSRWLKYESRCLDIASNCKRLLCLIRFPQMYVGELRKLESDDIASCRLQVNDDKTPEVLFLKLIGDAYRFRALCPEQESLELDFSEDFYSSRNYTGRIVDRVLLKNSIRFGAQVDVKYYKGQAPKEIFDAEWKICYRKKNTIWNIQVYSHDSSISDYKTAASVTILIFNVNNDVIQVHNEGKYVYSRGTACIFDVSLNDPDISETMAVIIKPL